MKQVEWIKIRVDMFEDEKMKLIQALPEGDAITLMWIRLLTMAGKTNDDGFIYLREGTPYTAQMLSIIFSKPQTVVELALKALVDFGMIQIDPKGICIVNWEKHQNIDGLEKIRKQNRERKRKQRERQKQNLLQPIEEFESRDILEPVTSSHAIEEEKEQEREKELETDIDKERKEQKKPITKENLCSKEDVISFVESHSTSNLLSVDNSLLIRYINCLRLTRKTGRISKELIQTEWEKWSKFPSTVITYAMWVHTEKHDDKKEEYTLGIMRNTNEIEANRTLKELIEKNSITRGETNIEHGTSTFTNSKSAGQTTTGKWDHFVVH
jgi:predicted phage replisome organizer